jgi:Domain of unknown function (DUF4410)
MIMRKRLWSLLPLSLLIFSYGCSRPVVAVNLRSGEVKYSKAPTFIRDSLEGLASTSKFERVVVLPFENGVGNALPQPLPQQVTDAIVSELSRQHPRAFQDVSLTPSAQPGVLLVQGKVIEYSPGNTIARAVLPVQVGSIAKRLKVEVTLLDSMTGQMVEQFATSTTPGSVFVDTEEMIKAAADEITDRIALHGSKK